MRKLLKTSLVFISALLLACLIYLAVYFINIHQSQSLIESTIQHAVSVDENNQTDIDWDKLKETNSDIVAWLEIPNTNISCPIVQYKNNSYYLRRNLKKEYSFSGTNFLDCSSSLDLNDDNTLIYGHNLRNKDNFSQLPNLFGSISATIKNQYINLYLPDKNAKYAVIGAFYTNSKASDDNGYVFPYNIVNMSDEYFKEFINELNQRFIYSSNITSDNKLLMLSTCAYEFKDERFVVVAKQIESENETISLESNPTPRYPQKWYEKNHMNNPFADYLQWDIKSNKERSEKNE